jgi:hypothetical protein
MRRAGVSCKAHCVAGPFSAIPAGMIHTCSRMAIVALLACSGAIQLGAQGKRELVATPVGPLMVLYDAQRQGCDANDIPDAPLRAYRDAEGSIAAFGLHYENRRLAGPAFDRLKPECTVVFRGNGDANPARYDDRAWIAATYTEDGRNVFGLVHHEFHGHAHPGRCISRDYMACWWNSIFAVISADGGKRFTRAPSSVMAASPEKSEIGQGRHRGFFNPSNIVKANGAYHALIATTGWGGQSSGVCLFQATSLGSGADWRAFTGRSFAARFPDPYSQSLKNETCQPIAPFPAPVGSVTRHEPTGLWLAVFQAAQGMPDGMGGSYPASGFYAASARDLARWSAPRLILETKTLYDSPCGESIIRAYPSLVDPASTSRNFETTGDEALLTYAEMPVEGCHLRHERRLVARKLRISSFFSQ